MQHLIIKFELRGRIRMQHDLLGSAIKVSGVSSYHSFNPTATSSITKKYYSGIHLSTEHNWSMEESLVNSSCQASLLKLCLEISAHKKETGSITASCSQN